MCSTSVHRQDSADRSMVTPLNHTGRQHPLQGTRQKRTGLSHHAQLSVCTNRDKMAVSRMEISTPTHGEFVAVVSWKVGWLCFFLHKICTRPIGRLVSQFYSPLGNIYPSGMTRWVVSSNTGSVEYHTPMHAKLHWAQCVNSNCSRMEPFPIGKI